MLTDNLSDMMTSLEIVTEITLTAIFQPVVKKVHIYKQYKKRQTMLKLYGEMHRHPLIYTMLLPSFGCGNHFTYPMFVCHVIAS